MYYCEKVKPLWDKLEHFCRYFFQVDVNLNVSVVILNNYERSRKELINLLIVILKQYVYSEKCFGVDLSFKNFMDKLTQWYFVDKCYAKQSDTEEICCKKWQNLF